MYGLLKHTKNGIELVDKFYTLDDCRKQMYAIGKQWNVEHDLSNWYGGYDSWKALKNDGFATKVESEDYLSMRIVLLFSGFDRFVIASVYRLGTGSIDAATVPKYDDVLQYIESHISVPEHVDINRETGEMRIEHYPDITHVIKL